MAANFGDTVKEELLTLQIKAPCCKASFITGTELFAKSRKNKFTDRVTEYKARLTHKKRKAFFDEDQDIGYKTEKQDGNAVYVGKRVCPYCHSMLVRGAFLVCGRANITEKPKVGIHVEMALPNDKVANQLAQALGELGIEPKRTVRKGEILIYYKKRAAIEDFIAYIGAVTQSFEVINDGIMKKTSRDVRSQITFDNINIIRSVEASARQVAAINAIIKAGSFDELPLPLRETAMIRLENSGESLDVITELHGGISRSTVNRRLQKIISFAKKKGYIIS